MGANNTIYPTRQGFDQLLSTSVPHRGQQNRARLELSIMPGLVLCVADLEFELSPAPGPGTLLTHRSVSSLQVHHMLRQLVKPRQVPWLFFPLTFHQGDASHRAGVMGLTGVKPYV